MNNLIRLHSQPTPVQESGRVLGIEGPRLVVETQSGTYAARRAASCLMVPALDDLVLLARIETGTVYVLSVLERESDSATEIAVDGDLSIRLTSGAFAVAAPGAVSLVSGTRVGLAAPELDVHAEKGHFLVDQLSFLGRVARTEIEKIKIVAGAFDSIVERISQTVQRSYRTVTEVDQLRAERIDYVAKKNMSLRGKNALLTAHELVKLDGDQIHLG